MTQIPKLSAASSLWRDVPVARRLMTFQATNALNFPIVIGAPSILMARSWGASPFYIGALAALVPLLTALQIYAGPRVEYWGFRRTMVFGWGARTAVLILIALLPFLSLVPGVSPMLLLQALFLLMIFFTGLRGIGSAAWNPWLVQLIPVEWRGRYLSAEQRAINIPNVLVLGISGWLLGTNPTGLHYGALYLFALLAGVASVYSLTRIPSPAPKQGPIQLEPIVSWAPRVWKQRPLRRILRMHAVFYLAAGGGASFMVLFLRDALQMSDRSILWIGGGTMMGAIASSGLWGALADRYDSKPMMMLATRVLLVDWICWMLVAGGVLGPDLWLIVLLYILFGVGMVGYTIGVNRYCMNAFLHEDLVLGFTMYVVAGSVATGLSPLLWGRFIDGVGSYKAAMGPVEWNCFSLYFLFSSVVFALSKMLLRKIPARKSVAPGMVVYQLFTEYPMRTLYAMSRLIQTTPGLAGRGLRKGKKRERRR